MNIIIPIHNIRRRGFERVANCLYSIAIANDRPEKVFIVDSSYEHDYNTLDKYIKEFDFAIHFPAYDEVFNKPKLLNLGLQLCDSEWIMCTDSDYIFSKDFFTVAKKHRSKKKLLHKQVKMLPPMTYPRYRIRDWEWPQGLKYNEHGTFANGACQYAHRSFWEKEQYDERQEGMTAMDNLISYKALRNGLKVEWLEGGEILHQWHPIEILGNPKEQEKAKKNQKIVHDYLKEHNLKPIFSRDN